MTDYFPALLVGIAIARFLFWALYEWEPTIEGDE